MLRPLALTLLLLVALLAGCASRPDAPDTESASPITTYTTVVGQKTGPLTTDTIHFLAPPTFVTSAPTAHKPVRWDIAPFTSTPGQIPTWDLTLKEDTQALHGQATMYGEVNGTVLNDPLPTAGGCFWEFNVYWDSLDPTQYPYLPCGVEPSVVPTGIHQVVVPIDLAGSWPAGTVLHFRFYSQDFARAPDAAVHLVTGSVDQDSQLTLTGLQLPLDADLLLHSRVDA